MPNIKSSIKQAQLTVKPEKENKPVRSVVKSSITRAEKAVAAGEAESKALVTAAISELDKAAKKGVLHANNAARRKSRLMKRLNALKAQ